MLEIVNEEVYKSLEKYTCNGTRDRFAICALIAKNVMKRGGGNWDCVMGEYVFTMIDRVRPIHHITYQLEQNEKLEVFVCC